MLLIVNNYILLKILPISQTRFLFLFTFLDRIQKEWFCWEKKFCWNEFENNFVGLSK